MGLAYDLKKAPDPEALKRGGALGVRIRHQAAGGEALGILTQRSVRMGRGMPIDPAMIRNLRTHGI